MARNCSIYVPIAQEPSTAAASEAEQTEEAKTMPLFGAVCRSSVEALSQDHVSGLFIICIQVLIKSTGTFLLRKKISKALKEIFCCLFTFFFPEKASNHCWHCEKNLISAFKFGWPSSIKMKAAQLTEI